MSSIPAAKERLLKRAETLRRRARLQNPPAASFDLEGWANELEEMARLLEENEHLKEREAHFAKVLQVADGGQYRHDWDARITAIIEENAKLRAERDEALEALKPFAEVAARYPTGGLKADIDQRSPDVVKLLDASAFYRAASLITKGGADANARQEQSNDA